MAQYKYKIKKGDWTYEVYVEKSPKYRGGYFRIRATRPYSVVGRNWHEHDRDWPGRTCVEEERPEKITVDLEVYVDRRKSLVDYLFFREGKADIKVDGETGEYFKKQGWKRTGILRWEDLLELYNLNLWPRDVRKIMTSEWPCLAKYFEKETRKRRNRRYEKNLWKILKVDPETLFQGLNPKGKYGLETVLSTA